MCGVALGLVRKKLVELVHEGVDVLELAVDGGEADVGDLVHAAQLVHHLLADGLGRDLALEGVLQVLLDLLADAFKLVSTAERYT